MSISPLTLATDVLRDPQAVIERHDNPQELAAVVPPLLGVIGVTGALFGVMVGSQHGGLQPVFAGLKMPLLLVIPPLVALPAVHAMFRACGVDVGWRRLSIAALAGMARSAVLAAAIGPVLWLLYSVDVDYHSAVLAMVGAIVLAGLPGIVTFVRSLPRGGHLRALAAVGSVAALTLAFAQTGWLLRPFVARPRAEVTFLRPVEENVFTSLDATQRSAQGNYSGWDVKQRGFLAPKEE